MEAISNDPKAIAAGLLARPGDWPPAAPNSITALACFHSMLEICSDGSLSAAQHSKSFAEAGGVRAVVQILEETALEIGRKAKSVDPNNLEMNRVLQDLMMLADVQTMGCTLLGNMASAAADAAATSSVTGDGNAAAFELVQDELRVSQPLGAVVRSMMLYPDNAEHLEAGIAALVQLLPVDPKAYLSAGAPSVIIGAMVSPVARPWLLYLGARALARTAQLGAEVGGEVGAGLQAEALAALQKDGAVPALVRAVRAPPDPTAGQEWGVADVWAKLQAVARTAIASLVGFDGFACGGRKAGVFDVNHFLLQDPVVVVGLEETPALNDAVGFVVGAGENGIGPQQPGGLYTVRIEYPEDKRGQSIEAAAAHLKLMAPQ